MALYLSNRDGDGKTNEEGHYRLLSRILDGAVLLDSDLKVTESSTIGLQVDVQPGDYRIETPLGYSYMGWNSNVETVSISSADISNPRITSIVLYIDKDENTSPAPPNNPGIPKLAAIDGVAQSSPTVPSNTVIQNAVGVNNPFIRLANINIPASITQVTDSYITDTRSSIKLINKLLDNIYPIGAIYENAISSTNPSVSLGFGTWEEFGQGRVLVGKTSTCTFKDLGSTGGTESVSLTAAQNGRHTHTGTTANAGNHAHSGNTGGAGNHTHGTAGHFWQDAGGSGTYNMVTGGNRYARGQVNVQVYAAGNHAHAFSTNTTGNHNHSFTTANSGNGQAHENLQPYITIYRWVRVA